MFEEERVPTLERVRLVGAEAEQAVRAADGDELSADRAGIVGR